MPSSLVPEQPDDDLIYLRSSNGAQPDDEVLANHLRDRYAKDIIYTRIGESVLVSVNPNKTLECNSQSSMKKYKTAVKNGTERSPHVFELAGNAYLNACKFRQDQALVFVQVIVLT
jgi:myosin heavy subunit